MKDSSKRCLYVASMSDVLGLKMFRNHGVTFAVSHRQLLRHYCDACSPKCRRNATHRRSQPSSAASSSIGFSWPETRNIVQVSDDT
jgi:hypothetical protein